jgi:hypothetical protein
VSLVEQFRETITRAVVWKFQNRYRQFEFTSLRQAVWTVYLQSGDGGKCARRRADWHRSWQRRERPILQIANSPRFLSVSEEIRCHVISSRSS